MHNSFLQANKTESNVEAICDQTSALRVVQVQKILNLYTPTDDFDERVTPAFMRKINACLESRAMGEKPTELLMPARMQGAVKFPFCPSNIQLEEVDIPEFYNGLQSLLKKI